MKYSNVQKQRFLFANELSKLENKANVISMF